MSSEMLLPSIKCALLAVCSYSYYVSFTPPNVATKTDKIVKSFQIFESFFVFLLFWRRAVMITSFTIQILVTLASAYDSPYSPRILSLFCPFGTPNPEKLLLITPQFLLGVALMVIGGALRVSCYRAMGTQFTYQITIKQKHRLISTGPYAYVRHPSYLAVIIICAGVPLVHFGQGMWMTEAKIMSTWGASVAISWMLLSTYAIWSLLRRTSVEDANLRQAIGPEWDSYRRKVPYAVFPGVY